MIITDPYPLNMPMEFKFKFNETNRPAGAHPAKLKKGYKDITALKTSVTQHQLKDITDKDIMRLLNDLQKYSKVSILNNYTVSAEQVTEAQLDKAQEIIGEVIDSIFLTVKREIWEKHVEQALKDVIIISVPLISDTSDLGAMIRAVYQYIIEAEIPYDEPDLILKGGVFKQEDFYYFTMEALVAYLRYSGTLRKNLNVYTVLTRIGATADTFNGISVWKFYGKKKEFQELLESKRKIQLIEERNLLESSKDRFE